MLMRPGLVEEARRAAPGRATDRWSPTACACGRGTGYPLAPQPMTVSNPGRVSEGEGRIRPVLKELATPTDRAIAAEETSRSSC